MKRLLLFFIFASTVFGQGEPVKNLYGSGTPQPSLAQKVGTTYVDQSTNPATVYTCTAVTLTRSSATCTWTASGSAASVGTGTLGQPTIYNSTSTVASSSQTVDASAFAGANWGAQVNAAVTAIGSGGGTIIVPDSLAANGTASTINLGASSALVNLKFTGTGLFSTCTINAGSFSHIDLGNALLSISGSNCIGINQTNTVNMQQNYKFIVQGGTIYCNGQTGATGIYVGNHADTVIRDTVIAGCTDATSSLTTPTGGLVLKDTQFAYIDGVKLYNDYAPLKNYTVGASGGGNSNTYTNLTINCFGPVGAIFGAAPTFSQGPNYLFNPTIQSCTVAGMAEMGNASVFQTYLYQYGGAPEVNGTTAITATFTNGSAVIAGTNSYVAGQTLQFTTTGTLPTNFAINTTYFVISTGLSSTQFEVSATSGGTAISAGSAGTGTQTSQVVAVIDGFTIKQASTYVNFGILFYDQVTSEEATITPMLFSENHSQIIIHNPTGYGNSSGNFCQTDATSTCLPYGPMNNVGAFPTQPQNLVRFPASGGFAAPSSSSMGYGFTGSFTSNIGVTTDGTNLDLNGGGSTRMNVTATGPVVYPGLVLGFNSAGFVNDTGLSRDSAGVLDVGNGTAGNSSGTVKAAAFSPVASVTWSSGAGVPSSGSCTAANGGSLFTRTDGTPTTTLYVCDNSTHVWTAK